MENIIYHKLSNAQKRIWYIEQLYPDLSMYNVGGTIRFKTKINFKNLEKAIKFFISNHVGARIQLRVLENDVFQYILHIINYLNQLDNIFLIFNKLNR